MEILSRSTEYPQELIEAWKILFVSGSLGILVAGMSFCKSIVKWYKSRYDTIEHRVTDLPSDANGNNP